MATKSKTALILGLLIMSLLFSTGCNSNDKVILNETSSDSSEIKTSNPVEPPTITTSPTETPKQTPKTDDGTVHFYYSNLTIDSRDYTLLLRNSPEDVQEINLTLDSSSLKGAKSIYITSDLSYDSYAIIAKNEIGNIPSILGLPTKYTFTSENDLGYEKKTCSDSTPKAQVIDIRLGSETKVFNEGSCIVVQGANYKEMINAADRLTYFWAEFSNTR